MMSVSAKNLVFGYSSTPVIRDVSFQVDKGEFISILGPNGSGKSTLLKTINGLYIPSSGRIELMGENIERYKRRDIARRISLVPQDTSLQFEFTVEEVVTMGRHPFKGRFEKEDERDRKLIYEAMEMTNTFDIRDRLITEISGGERQRVYIAKALAQNTEIILLDEPTSHLDINHQIDILNLLRRMNQEKGITIILVIHDINLATRFSDRILLLKKGSIISQGTPEDVITTENILNAYGMRAAVERNRYTGHISVIPLEVNKRIRSELNIKVHVISGGGSGQDLINVLYHRGYQLSLGVLNAGDTDWQYARSLKIPLSEEKPFSAISDRAAKKNREMLAVADLVIMTNVPIGGGNLRNLKMAWESLENGKKVYYLEDRDYDEFDYTGGEATALLERMIENGLIVVDSMEQLLRAIS
ncbi:MAG: heme ABC transporter ATP-binding protein [Gudongella sp.]|nr:heme ABC transporter ATP-binding protein [Gudongella sp.]